jgi:lipopolysaccharide export system protein LptC
VFSFLKIDTGAILNDRFSTGITAAILTVLVAGTWWASDYAQRAVQLDPPAKSTHEPDTWAKNIVLLRSNETGMTVSRLEGDYIEHFPDNESYEIQVPRAFNVKSDSPMTLATSKTAVLHDDGNRIIMEGNAVLTRLGDANNAPLTFSSEVLTMLVDQDLAYTELPAVAINGRSRLSGVGMTYNNKTRQLNVLNATDVDIAPRENDNENASDQTGSTTPQPLETSP